MTAYISGPITGVNNYKENFRKAAFKLRKLGYEVINPAELCPAVLPESVGWDALMEICMKLPEKADVFVMLPGWPLSEGAKREGVRAAQLGIPTYALSDVPEWKGGEDGDGKSTYENQM